MTDRGFQLQTVVVGDQPAAWERAGFVMHGATTRIGSTTIVCRPEAGPGIVAVAIDGLTEPIDDLPLGAAVVDAPPPTQPHTNRVTGFDHLVALSPSIDRTSTALQRAGLERRRSRKFAFDAETRRQDFFWLGDVILELAGVVAATGASPGSEPDSSPESDAPDEPASFWGLALECDHLDAAAGELGAGLGRIKDAVQPGRRIATIRTQELGLSVPIALMSPHLKA